jgi:hypothetical protein
VKDGRVGDVISVITSNNSQQGFAEILLHESLSNNIAKICSCCYLIMNYCITW